MTRKISVTISIDGTGNNKNSDTPSGNQTNVARIHDLIDAELAFDFSVNRNNGSEELKDLTEKGAEGTPKFFDKLLKHNSEIIDETSSYKFYLDGVGSQVDQDSIKAKTEQSTGLGSANRVETAMSIVSKLREVYGADVEIEITPVSFSRGNAAAKDFCNKLLEKYAGDQGVTLHDGVFLIQ